MEKPGQTCFNTSAKDSLILNLILLIIIFSHQGQFKVLSSSQFAYLQKAGSSVLNSSLESSLPFKIKKNPTGIFVSMLSGPVDL